MSDRIDAALGAGVRYSRVLPLSDLLGQQSTTLRRVEQIIQKLQVSPKAVVEAEMERLRGGHTSPDWLGYCPEMTVRQRLDQAVLSVTGEDIRLVGNWESLSSFDNHAEQLTEQLNVPILQFMRCRDIADVLELMERAPAGNRANEGPSLL